VVNFGDQDALTAQTIAIQSFEQLHKVRALQGANREVGTISCQGQLTFNNRDLFTGAGGEKPDTDQLGSMTAYEENTAFWVGASYTFFDRLMFMFYWHQIQTEGALTGKTNALGELLRKDKKGNSYTALVRFSF